MKRLVSITGCMQVTRPGAPKHGAPWWLSRSNIRLLISAGSGSQGCESKPRVNEQKQNVRTKSSLTSQEPPARGRERQQLAPWLREDVSSGPSPRSHASLFSGLICLEKSTATRNVPALSGGRLLPPAAFRSLSVWLDLCRHPLGTEILGIRLKKTPTAKMRSHGGRVSRSSLA